MLASAPATSSKTIRCSKIYISFSVFLCAIALVVTLPQYSFADVKSSDLIGNSTVEQLGIPVTSCPDIACKRAILVDKDGNILFGRSPMEPAQIASITKVMTAIVAIDNAPLDMQVSVSQKAASVGESAAGLQAGDTMSLDIALKALLVPSGNDAGVAIAESVGRYMVDAGKASGTDYEQVFIDVMNQKADELMLVDTVYENPHGLDFDSFAGNLHSNASDQGIVARYAMTYPEIRTIVGGGDTSIVVNRDGSPCTIDLKSTDELLEMYEFTIGIKTGVTDLAEACFMGAANNGEYELYSVVLGSDSEYDRFVDTKNLFEWGFSNLVDYQLVTSNETVSMSQDGQTKDVPVVAYVSHKDWIDKTVPATVADPSQTITVFKPLGNISQKVEFNDLTGTIETGDVIGSVTYYQHNKALLTCDLIAAQTVKDPNPWESIKIFWNRFRNDLDETNNHAPSEIVSTMTILNDHKRQAA